MEPIVFQIQDSRYKFQPIRSRIEISRWRRLRKSAILKNSPPASTENWDKSHVFPGRRKSRQGHAKMSCNFKIDTYGVLILCSQRNIRHVLRLTKEEDDFLKEGITKHGFGQWTAILRDDDFQFQDGRTADSLKKRAGMKMQLV